MYVSVSHTSIWLHVPDLCSCYSFCRVAGYFGDLGDGVHKGDVNDPRVSAIEVTPEEIHYWYATSGTVSRTAQVAVGAVTGKTAAPGELRTITRDEVRRC